MGDIFRYSLTSFVFNMTLIPVVSTESWEYFLPSIKTKTMGIFIYYYLLLKFFAIMRVLEFIDTYISYLDTTAHRNPLDDVRSDFL